MQVLFFAKNDEKYVFGTVVESGGGEKWWRIMMMDGEWWRLSFFDGKNLGKSGFFGEKNILKIGILGLYFCGDCITMWLIVAQSGLLWWKNTIKVGKW